MLRMEVSRRDRGEAPSAAMTDTSPQSITAWRGALAVFVLAFAQRIIAVFVWPTLTGIDELYQGIEQGHRLVFGYGLVPWEFDYAARSWLIAYATAGLMKASLLIGGQPAQYLALIGCSFAALSTAILVGAYLFARQQLRHREALYASLVPMTWIDWRRHHTLALTDE